jgi:hypothetical protein
MLARHRGFPRLLSASLGLVGLVVGSVLGFASVGLLASPHRTAVVGGGPVAGFRHVVYLSHLNNPYRTPGSRAIPVSL